MLFRVGFNPLDEFLCLSDSVGVTLLLVQATSFFCRDQGLSTFTFPALYPCENPEIVSKKAGKEGPGNLDRFTNGFFRLVECVLGQIKIGKVI